MTAGVMPALEDSMVKNPRLLQTLRAMQTLDEQLGSENRRAAELMEIEEALDTYLGQDLISPGLWDGDRSKIHIREPTPEEAARWIETYQRAITEGAEDAGDES